MKPHSHDVGVARAFDCFCKKVLRNEARDYQDALARKRNREVYFSELPIEVLEQFAVRDTYFTDTNFAENQKYFICSTYRKGKDLCTTHSIKNVVLHEIVLRNLREAISYVSEHEAEFIRDAAESDMRDRDAEFVRKRENLAKAETRIAELDRIISRLYEDNVIGKLSDERFIKMSHDYELEQSNLKSMAEVLRKDLKQQEQQKTNVKAFIAAVKKYTDLQELDAAVLRAFIDRIEVSHVDKKSRTREITIVYNFIGAFDFTRAIENARNISKKEQRTA